MTKYSCLFTRYISQGPNSRIVNCVDHYVETEFYGEACLYHKLGYSVVKWPNGNIPTRFGHKMIAIKTKQIND